LKPIDRVMRVPKRPLALTIAGSDPSGGAGVQADLKTFAALKVYGYSALTAVIAQNSSTVARVAAVAPAMVAAQIAIVAAEHRPDAIKIGALANAAVVRAVARCFTTMRLPAPVIDPVLMSSSGTRLLDSKGERALRTHLIPLARIITPNLPEAEALTNLQISDGVAMREAARKLCLMGARAVVIKGGHFKNRRESVDLFYDGRDFIELRGKRLPGGGAHGTGCAFSSAIAAFLARGEPLPEAVRAAKRYLTMALERSFRLGSGRALLDHFPRP
jgi:hydroxymethylpyrimidine/phosphomethylpyrimidine kinase